MERLTARRPSRGAIIAGVVVLLVLVSGPGNVARLISGATSVLTWPLTREISFDDNRYEIFNVNLLLVYLLAVLGINLLMQSGLVSLGHSAFFGLGAYLVALGTTAWGLSFWVALLLAGVAGGVLGVLLGLPALRLGLYALVMVTVGYAFVAEDLALEWRSFTGGGDGVRGVEFPSPFSSLETYYWLLALLAVIAFTVHRNLIRSPFGRASKAIEENEVAARAVGLPPFTGKLRPFVVSAVVASLAGGLYAPLIGFVAPDSITLQLAILLVLMVLLGGAGTVVGPVVGALLLFRLPIEVERVASQPGDWSLLVYGLLLLLSVFLFPRGLMSAWWKLRRRWRTRSASDDDRSQASIAPVVVPRSTDGAVIELSGIRTTLSGVKALQGVDLVVRSGTVHALIGPNGSGKTTLLNVISGFLVADAGVVTLPGGASGPVHVRARNGVARTFQTPYVFAEMSCLENVMVALDSHGEAGTASYALRLPSARRTEKAHLERATTLLTAVGLGHRVDVAAEDLPPGERRLLEIARVVALDPLVVVMDEPAAGLTSGEIAELEDVIRAFRDKGIAVLLVEHHVDLVMRLADEVSVLDFGRVIAHGKPADVAADPVVVAAYLGGDAAEDGIGLEEAVESESRLDPALEGGSS